MAGNSRPLKRIVAPQKVKPVESGECGFCNNITSLHKGNHLVMVSPHNPYLPKHVMFVPPEHVEKMAHLSSETFTELMDVLAKLDPLNGIALINEGRSSGQSDDHVHVHYVVPPRGIREEKEFGLHAVHTGAELRDPLSRDIIDFALQNKHLILKPEENSSQNGRMIVLKFENWNAAKESKSRIAEISKGLENALGDMSDRGKLEGYPEAIKRRIAGFGINFALAKVKRGVEIYLMPRAMVIPGKGPGAIEVFLNLIPDRTGTRGNPVGNWSEARAKFNAACAELLKK